MTRPWRRRRRRRVTNEFRKKEVDIILAWSVRGDGHPASSRTAVLSSLHLDSFASPAHLVSFTEVFARDCPLTLSARPLYHTSDAWRPESSLSRAHRSTASAARRLQIGSVGSWEHRLHTEADYPTPRPPSPATSACGLTAFTHGDSTPNPLQTLHPASMHVNARQWEASVSMPVMYIHTNKHTFAHTVHAYINIYVHTYIHTYM